MSSLPRVLLIGDSIRMGYEPTVRQELSGQAEVLAPEENCGPSTSVLNNIRRWIFAQKPDVVHINAGLHDLKTILFDVPRDQRELMIPLPFHVQNVERILRLIRMRTQAKTIWATNTPIHDENSARCRAKTEDFNRYDEDVVAYNNGAVEVCRSMQVPVNDLYTAVRERGLESLQDLDGGHFTPAGYAFLGKIVAEAIRRLL